MKIIEASAVISARAGDMSGIDKMAANLLRVSKAGQQMKSSFSGAALDMSKRVEEISSKLSKIDNFRTMSRGLDQASIAMRAAQQNAARLRIAMDAASSPSAQMVREYARASRAVERTSAAFRQQGQAVREARSALEASGVPVSQIARQQSQLRQSLDATTAAMQRQAKARRENSSDSGSTSPRPRLGTTVPLPPRRPHDLPVAEAAGSVGVVSALQKALTAGADIDSERQQAEQAGWTPDEIAMAEQRANVLARRYGVSPGSAFNIIREGRPTFGGDLSKTLSNVEPFFDVGTLMRQKNPGASTEMINKNVTDLVKAGEILGYSSDPAKLKAYANFMSQMVQVHGSALRGEEVLNFAKSGKSAASGVDFEFLKAIFPSLLPEQGGDRLGTALMTFRQAMVGGKMKKRAAENLADLGLIDRGGMISTNDDDVKGVKRNAVVGADLLEKNPLAWVQQHLVPAMDRKGVSPQERSAMLSTLFSDRNAEYLINLLVTQMSRLEKDRATVERAKGLEGAKDALTGDPYVLAHRVAGGAANVGAALSDPLIGPIKKAGDSLASALGAVADTIRGKPGEAAAGVLGGGTLGGVLAGLWSGGGLLARGAALVGGAGGGALLGGAALPLLARLTGDTAKGIGSVAAGKYYIPADQAAMDDLRRQLAERQAEAAGITARLHPSRRGEPNAQLDVLKGQIADLENRIGLGAQLRNLQTLVDAGGDPELARRRLMMAPLSPVTALEWNRLELNKDREISTKVEGSVNSTTTIEVKVGSDLIRIDERVKRLEATIPLRGGSGPGSTGTSMPEAAAPNLGSGNPMGPR